MQDIFGKNKKRDESSSEKIAMTSPVLLEQAKSEKIAMTSPVLLESTKNEKIDMTSPVTLNSSEIGWCMSFIMPSKYTKIEELPEPVDPSVKLEEIPETTLAAIQFSGYFSEEARQAKELELRDVCQKEGIQLDQDPNKVVSAGYNPPWCLPFLRTNEVMIPVQES